MGKGKAYLGKQPVGLLPHDSYGCSNEMSQVCSNVHEVCKRERERESVGGGLLLESRDYVFQSITYVREEYQYP